MCDLYLKSADVIGKILDKRGSTKNLIYGSNDNSNKKALYALVNETLKYKDAIEELISMVSSKTFKSQVSTINRNLLLVMIYELLLGPKGKIQGGGKVKRFLTEHLSELKTALVKLKTKHNATENSDLLPESLRNIIPIPRYVRINTLKTTIKEATDHFTSRYASQNPRIDEHVTDLVVLPPNIDLHEDYFILERKAIIQDKASCFPPFVLQPPENSIVIDACSAPGNKTSYLAALMKGTGTVYAFEKDTRRFNTLSKFMRLSGCTNVKTIHDNFLHASPRDKTFSKVEYILVDPSCSGSGIVNRMENHLENEEQDSDGKEERLTALSKFQVEVLSHALTFPNVKRVVYSTCSIHREENEDVVNTILQKFPKFQLKQDILPTWSRRGLPLFEGAEGCVRTDAKEDQTQGFFVACFERKPEEEINQEIEATTISTEDHNEKEEEENDQQYEDSPSAQKRDREDDTKSDKQKKKKRKKKNRKPITL